MFRYILIFLLASFLFTPMAALATSTSVPAHRPANVAFKVYPNPFVDAVTLEIEASSTPLAAFHLFDITGREVMTLNLGNRTSFTNEPINLSHLQPGIYVASLITADGRISSQRIIKQR